MVEGIARGTPHIENEAREKNRGRVGRGQARERGRNNVRNYREPKGSKHVRKNGGHGEKGERQKGEKMEKRREIKMEKRFEQEKETVALEVGRGK